jgi:uncharacterized protein (DUF697 family)
VAGWRDLGNIWTTFRQLDVRPIRDEAEQPLTLAFVGADGAGKSTLIGALRHDARAHEKVITPAIEADLNTASRDIEADLIVLVLDATRSDYSAEANLYRQWKSENRNVVVFYNKTDAVRDGASIGLTGVPWANDRVAFGSAVDSESLKTEFVPRVLEAVQNHLALARRYPIFRLAVAREVIGDTSFANATYSLGTGLAEVIPALDIPFNVADMVVLTKNQAIMVYKLGLALGLPPRWQDHVTQLGGVVGAGFVWRQLARQLVGLIPVWGIVPKVAVASAGTFAVGEAVIYWYQNGHKISAQGMRQVNADALMRGRQVAQSLLERTPRPALPKMALPRPRSKTICSHCGKETARDATYCAYCGKPLKDL